jgi:WD40 repeat protein
VVDRELTAAEEARAKELRLGTLGAELIRSDQLQPLLRYGSGHLKHTAPVDFLAAQADGEAAIAVDLHGWLRAYRIATGAALGAKQVWAKRPSGYALHPTGRWLAVVGPSGVLITALRGDKRGGVVRGLPPGGAEAAAFSSSGDHLAVAKGVRVHLVALQGMRVLASATLPGESPVVRMALAPGGELLAAAKDGGVHRLELEPGAGRYLEQVGRFTPPITALAVSPDGQRGAAGTRSGVVALWRSGGGTRTFPAESGPIWDLGYLSGEPAQLQAVTARAILRWPLDAPRRSFRLRLRRPCAGGSGSRDGAHAALVDRDPQRVRLLRVDEGVELPRITGHDGWVTDVAEPPDGTYLVTASRNGAVRRWEEGKGSLLVGDLPQAPSDLGVTQDGRRVVIAGPSGVGRVVDAKTGALILHLPDELPATLCLGGRYREWTAVGTDVGRVHLYRPNGTRPEKQVRLSDRPLRALFADGEELLAYARGDGPALLLRWRDGEGVRAFPAAHARGDAVAVRRPSLALLGASDGSLYAYALEDGRELARARAHARGVLAVAFSPDGARAVTGGLDSRLLTWGVGPEGSLTLLEDLRLNLSQDMVTSLTTLPSGELVVGTARGVVVRCRWR